jgi:hypothetical protein
MGFIYCAVYCSCMPLERVMVTYGATVLGKPKKVFETETDITNLLPKHPQG